MSVDETKVRALMEKMQAVMDASGESEAVKCCAAMHFTVGHLATLGCDQMMIWQSLDAVMKANPALAMVTTMTAGTA